MAECKKCLVAIPKENEFICNRCKVGVLQIPGIFWSARPGGAVGISEEIMREGLNLFIVPVKSKQGKYYYQDVFYFNKEALIVKYGPIETINKNNKLGIFVPVNDLPKMRYDLIRDKVENGNRTPIPQ